MSPGKVISELRLITACWEESLSSACSRPSATRGGREGWRRQGGKQECRQEGEEGGKK